jgi:hypothetical protein
VLKSYDLRRIGFTATWLSLGVLLLASQGWADGVSFNSPTGDLGSATQTYTLDGVNIVATGFNGGDLFGKNAGPGEQGVGLTGDPSGDHEIFFKSTGTQDFIQLDLLNLINAGFTSFQFQMSSTTGGEGWSVSACSVSGTDCFTSPATGLDETLHSVPGGFSKTNHFLDFSATNGNVLLDMIAATPPTPAPEASTSGLLLSGMLGLVAVVLWKRRTAEQA